LPRAAKGIVCMDINPSTASFDKLGDRVLRGDVKQFDD
jgi:hypothetical protein